MLRSYLLFCYAEWWLNNMHYPCHQPQGSIFPVLLVRPGSLRSDGVSFPASVGDWRPNFHSSIDWCAWGKGQTVEQMKWDYEDEGICWLNICVNGTLDFSFPISALMICLRLLPWRSALLPYPSLITWEQHAFQVHFMVPHFYPLNTEIYKFDFITPLLADVNRPPRQYINCSPPHDMSNMTVSLFSLMLAWTCLLSVYTAVFTVLNRTKKKKRLHWIEYLFFKWTKREWKNCHTVTWNVAEAFGKSLL